MFEADENVSQSRVTVWTSSALVTDQKPASSGDCAIPALQFTGHLLRSSRNSSCGGPSRHRSSSATWTVSSDSTRVCDIWSDLLGVWCFGGGVCPWDALRLFSSVASDDRRLPAGSPGADKRCVLR